MNPFELLNAEKTRRAIREVNERIARRPKRSLVLYFADPVFPGEIRNYNHCHRDESCEQTQLFLPVHGNDTREHLQLFFACPGKDKRGFDLISDVLPFGRLWYADSNAVGNAIGYAKFFSRSHHAVIRVYDEAGNVIETHEQAGGFKEP